MAIQNRRGAYSDFDPQKLVPGEWAVVQSGDPNSERGKAVYMAFEVGDVERMATYEDMLENINQATSDVQAQFTNELTQTITNANSAVSDMQDDIDAEIQSASTTVSTLTTQVNTAVTSANTATTNANAATDRANDAVEAIQSIIDGGNTVLSWNGRAGEVEPQAGDYTSAQITHGAGTVSDALTNGVEFTSADTELSPTASESVGLLNSSDIWSARLYKISKMFKNIRYLLRMLGSTNISSIGDGTITGAVSSLNGNLTPFYLKTVTGTTSSTGVISTGIATSTYFIVAVRITGQIALAFWRGVDEYAYCYNANMTPLANTSVKLEIMYCKRTELGTSS